MGWLLTWIAGKKFATLLAPLLRVGERLAKRPSFVENPAEITAKTATRTLNTGDLRRALVGAVSEKHSDAWLWHRTVDKLLDDIGQDGILDEQAVSRLELACHQLSEEGSTTLWQYVGSGGLNSLEKRLWNRTLAQVSSDTSAATVRAILIELSEHGDLSCDPKDHRWEFFETLASSRSDFRPLLTKTPSGATNPAAFRLRIHQHRKACSAIASEMSMLAAKPLKSPRSRRHQPGRWHPPKPAQALVLVLGILGALVFDHFLRIPRHSATVAGQLLVAHPDDGLEIIREDLNFPGAAETFTEQLYRTTEPQGRRISNLQTEDAFAQTVALVLLDKPERAYKLVAHLTARCSGDPTSSVCQTLTGYESQSSPTRSADEEELKVDDVDEAAKPFWQAACLATLLEKKSPRLCFEKDDLALAAQCRVDKTRYQYPRSRAKQAQIEPGLQIRRTQVALHRLGCRTAIDPPDNIERFDKLSSRLQPIAKDEAQELLHVARDLVADADKLIARVSELAEQKNSNGELAAALDEFSSLAESLKPDGIPGNLRVALDMAVAVSGKITRLSGLARQPSGAGRLASDLLRFSLEQAPETSDPARLEQILQRDAGAGLAQLWDLAITQRLDHQQPSALPRPDRDSADARDFLRAPLGLPDLSWQAAAANKAFISAAHMALAGPKKEVRKMIETGRCGFHCLAGLVGAVCGPPSGPPLQLQALASTGVKRKSPCAELLRKKLLEDPTPGEEP